jgi:phosphoglycolate phosphatase
VYRLYEQTVRAPPLAVYIVVNRLAAHGASLGRPERALVSKHPLAILFDIDGTLINTGGAGAASWRLAFEELYGIPADIGQFTDAGMTDPAVGRKTFEAVLKREPERREFTRLMERRNFYLHQTVQSSKGYEVLPGVDEHLPRLIDDGYLLGIVTGNVEAAAHIKLHRANLNRFFSFGGYGSDSDDRGEVTRTALKRASLVYGEQIDRDQAFAVGDTPLDVTGAHAADIECVGVGSHKYSADELREAGADYVITSLEEGLPPLAAAPMKPPLSMRSGGPEAQR